MTACLCSNGQISVSSTKRREGENKKVMRKRRGRSEISEETLNSEEKGSDFFACYLLASLSPRHKGHSYIGFTVNPRRRIRQHNGEITSGAWRTKSKRPWEMVVCIYGFPTNVSALQFEWAWQHPTESLAVRAAAAGFKSLSGIANKIKLVYTMLTLPAWKSLNLSVNFFSTKYTKHSAGCPSLPEHMRVHVSPMDELPCYSGGDQSFFDNAWDDDEELGEKGSSSDGLDQVTAHEETTLEQFGGVEEHGLRQPGDSACPEFHYSEEGQENTMRQPANLPTSKAEYRLTFSVIDFSVRTSPFSAEVTLDDKDTSGLNEENTLLTEGSPSTVAADRGEPKISSLDTSCETEVIDLLICSPEHRIDPYFKKRTSPFSADVTLDDKYTSGLDEENILLTEQSPATVAADRVEPKISSLDTPCEIEVIDLLSCSPGYRIDPCFKKRRATTVHPEIIDLTNSPIFVDL